MSSVINVKPDKLVTFKEELNKTPVMLENIFNENKELITKTTQHIDMTIDTLNRKRIRAQQDLEQARANLAAARKEEDGNTDFYIEQIEEASKRLGILTDAYKEVKGVKEDYRESTEQYFRDEERYFQEYNTITKKGSSILEKYTELVRRSTAVISEG